MTTPLPHDEAEFLVHALERLDAHGESLDFIADLLSSIELGHFDDPGHRARLAPALLQAALALRDRPGTIDAHEYLVWSALRRFASLAPEEDLGQLARFMGDNDRIHTRICALQCVNNAFFGKDPTCVDHALRTRVETLTFRYLTPEIALDPDVRLGVLAVNAALALTALLPETLPAVATHLRALNAPGLERLAASRWSDMIDFRAEHMGTPTSPALEEGVRLLGYSKTGSVLTKYAPPGVHCETKGEKP